MIKIFVGFDECETVAYHVCSNSLIRHSTRPIAIVPLALNVLHDYEEVHFDGSNKFIYSRFLVPYLMSYKGWAIFMDGDMIVTDDIVKLFDIKDESKAVFCVKHNYKTKSTHKYMGKVNENYPRKNWSSVVLWNCSHPSNKILDPSFIQKSSGSFLHRFKWLKDDEIGELPIEWNWLPDEFGSNDQAKLLHWTLGTPCFKDFSDSPMAKLWRDELSLTTHCA